MAPLISLIASTVAAFGDKSNSSILACTASTTTMASSTTIPMANTNANNVIRFKVMPKNCINKNVPIKDIGTAMAGIKVDLKSPKNRNTTKATNIKASINV